MSFNSSSLTFAPPFTTQNDTGIFAGFSSGAVTYLLGTVDYMGGLPQTEEAFYITDASNNVLAFYDERNSPVQSYDAQGNLNVTLNESGFYTLNGGAGMAGTFSLSFAGTSSSGSASDVAFYGTGSLSQATSVGVTPEPSSYLLLGTGFLLAASFLRGKRQFS